MSQHNSLFVSDLASDEQVVSYLLDIRTRTYKFVIGILEAIDMLQEAKFSTHNLLSETKEKHRSHQHSRPHSITVESVGDWNSKLTTAETKLLIAVECMHDLKAVVHSFADENCSLKVRKAVQDVKASQRQLENKLHFSRSLLRELTRLKDELLFAALITQ